MDEGWLQENALYCCFVDLKQTFDTVPWSEIWNWIVEIGMPQEYELLLHDYIRKLGMN